MIPALFCVKLSSGEGLVYQRSSSRSPCDLDLECIDLKIDRDTLHTKMNVCSKFSDPSFILCQVIIRTRFGILTDRQTYRPTDMSKAIYPHFVEGGHKHCEKRRNCLYKQFLFFPQCFLLYQQ